MRTLIFDGDCSFCTRSAAWLERRVPDDVDVAPWQELELDAIGLTIADVTTAAYFVDAEGRTWRGHRGIGKVLMACTGPWRVAGFACLVPPTAWLAAAGYRLVARYRYRLPGGSAACRLESGFTQH